VSSRNRPGAQRLSPTSLLDQLTTTYPAVDHYCLAYSGGIDSTVLLHLLVQIHNRLPAPLSAVHVDHGLQAESSGWAAHCAAQSSDFGIPLASLSVDATPAHGHSPEAAARHARYRAIAAELPPRTLLLTAHHRDDQAETLLLQLLRGSGIEGLSAMPRWRKWEQGWLGRPLLDIARVEIADYADSHGLQWIDDPSNARTHADRNFLRQQVMPLLQSRWPSAPAAIARTASHCGAAVQSLQQQAGQWLQQSLGDDGHSLGLELLRGLGDDDAGRLLRAWLRYNGIDMPSTRRLQELLRQAVLSADDGVMRVPIENRVVRRYRDRLWLTDAVLPRPPVEPQAWHGDAIDLGDCGRLERHLAPGGIDPDAWAQGTVTVVFRAPGMRFTPTGRRGTRSFKKLAQEYGVPPWLRQLTPIVLIDGQPAAIGGICVCEGFAAGAAQAGWHVAWSTQ